MELKKEELYALVSRIIESYEQEREMKKKRKPVYVLFSGEWEERFATILDQITDKDSYQFTGILSKKQMENPSFVELGMKYCDKLILREEAIKIMAFSETTIIPVLHRDLLVKAALCISDTFEVSWIQKAMETGGKVTIMANGLDPFTGKEPKAYREKILSYIKTLMEYDIEIKVKDEER